MKTKQINEILQSNLTTALGTLSQHLVNKGINVAFFLHENDAIQEEVDGVKTISYGFLIESQIAKKTRKLYFRKYDLANKSLNDTKLQAYLEFLDVITGTFLLTAMSADDKTLMELSLKRS